VTRWFDSHCHLQNSRFGDGEADALVTAAAAEGVERILNLGTRLADAGEVIALARRHPACLAAIGVHPSDLDDWSPETEEALMELAAASPEVVVWGEIGIDYYWKDFEHDLQRRVFRRQLDIARELKLPVSIHCRDAYDDMVADLAASRGGEVGGVAHCFSGTLEHARALTDMGFALGVGGSSTYPKSGELREVLRAVGIDHLVVETDAPFLAPQARRGKRNEPAFVRLTGEALAETLELDAEAVAGATWRNTVRAFRLADL
jgi:TatD DNase family protein